MDFLLMESWSPYVVGAGIGVLSWLTFLFSNKPLGCSTSFATTFGMLEKLIRGDKAASRPYYQKVKPKIDWQWMFVLGIIGGSALSAVSSGTFQWTWVPEFWAVNIAANLWVRLGMGFLGGILIGLGSRWAGGCTSGHGISGTLQMAVSSWLAVICFFASAIVTALILYS